MASVFYHKICVWLMKILLQLFQTTNSKNWHFSGLVTLLWPRLYMFRFSDNPSNFRHLFLTRLSLHAISPKFGKTQPELGLDRGTRYIDANHACRLHNRARGHLTCSLFCPGLATWGPVGECTHTVPCLSHLPFVLSGLLASSQPGPNAIVTTIVGCRVLSYSRLLIFPY